MILLFKQRLFSWFSSYDIYAENGERAYHVEGQFALGHKLFIYDNNENKIGEIRERLFTFLHKYDMYFNEEPIGTIVKEFSFFTPKYYLTDSSWEVSGDFFGLDYQIMDAYSVVIASLTKELLHFTDTYVLDIVNPNDAVKVLMVVLAIDAARASDTR